MLSLGKTQTFELLPNETVTLYIPAICLTEARETVPRRFNPRSRSEDLRKFLKWAKNEGKVNSQDAKASFRVFDGLVANELTKVPERLDALAKLPHINVFPLSETMLERQISLGALDLSIKPYDLAVLAAVIVKAEELQQKKYSWVGFCELDSDLLPWDKSRYSKPILSKLYDDARIWVYDNFFLEDIEELPQSWEL